MEKLYRLPGAWPYSIAIFLNAFVDLGHKIVIQNTVFQTYSGDTQVVLTALINALILLPFVIFFTPAGQIADRYAKVRIMRLSAWAAVAICMALTGAYHAGWFWAAFVLTLLLSIQSAFYSPAKYGLVKSLFGKSRLAEANGMVQAITIAAVLAGTITFTLVFALRVTSSEAPGATLTQLVPLGWLLVLNSLVEALMLHRLPADEVNARRSPSPWWDHLSGRIARAQLGAVIRQPVLRLSIIGLATFWSVGQVMLATFPAYAKAHVGIDSVLVLQGILAASGVGVALGSALASRLSPNRIETGLIPVGALGVACGLAWLPLLDSAGSQAVNFAFIGLMGGLFITPLNALIQFHAREGELGSVLAANNWIQNLAMLGFLVFTAGAALGGVDSPYLLALVAVMAILGGLYTVVKLPQSLVRFVLAFLLTRHYRVSVQGLENLPAQGGVLLLGNHISWIDWAIVQIASPRPIRFVLLKSVYERRYLKGMLKALGCIPIERGAGAERALDTVAECLNAGEVVCLFPEGAISRTGQLGEFRRGFERACQRADDSVIIVPFYLRGLWGSQFSRSSSKLKALRDAPLHRAVVVAFGAPMPRTTSAAVIKRRIVEQATHSWQRAMAGLPTLPQAWIRSVKRAPRALALTDADDHRFDARGALIASLLMAGQLRQRSRNNDESDWRIGLLLPRDSASAIANMATLLAGGIVVNLNYTASASTLAAMIDRAELTTIVTSRAFLDGLARQGLDVTGSLDERKRLYVEDLAAQPGRLPRLLTRLAVTWLPATTLAARACRATSSEKTAAILFSSGSEGEPKGVKLSHRNILANVQQTSDVLNTQHGDVVLGSLPIFHAFGLTVTQFLPLIEGLPLICHPEMTDAAGIARSIARHRATILCGTPTSLDAIAREPEAHASMLESLRIVIAGGERLDPRARQAFETRFHKPLFEGYGATETAPVAAVNLPDALDVHYAQVQRGGKVGTVGMPLPGTSIRVVDPTTLEELPVDAAGRVLVSGPQVMQGYLDDVQTAEVIVELAGQRWYVTGDRGALDSDGFLTLIDRASRCVRIGEEMISLGEIERAITRTLDDDDIELVAVNLPDSNWEERIVVLSETSLDGPAITRRLRETGLCTPTLPSAWLTVEHLPRLDSGKVDVMAARRLAAANVTVMTRSETDSPNRA
ncbi:acyl-[ACP]--phospholipid O-acyltransferase [Salinicola halophilus]|uniref:acyl-[ACP]--phospholipid O-acyltransferase n=1 Tax=Salinicola halophilus TaxID=184065 RepID=UPI000DA1E58B|nr:acyl-[ACP]--phospholipid O-acyltransferase [Salinicola halophilus]